MVHNQQLICHCFCHRTISFLFQYEDYILICFLLGRNSNKRPLWIIVVAASLLSILLCFICSMVWLRRRRKGIILAIHSYLCSLALTRFEPQINALYLRSSLNIGKIDLHDEVVTNRPEEDALVWRLEEKSSEFTLYDFSEILQATDNFFKENLLGQGGFGPVYKVNALS